MTGFISQLKTQLFLLSTNPLYKKYSIFLVPTLATILAVCLVVFLTIPQFFKISQTNTQIDQLKQQQQQYQGKIAILEKVDLNQYKASLEDLLYTLPNEKDIPGAITSILQLISTSGLQLGNISLGAATTEKEGSSFLVKLDLSGTIEQLKALISLSGQSPRMIKINGISLNNSSQNTTQASVDVLVFYAVLDTNTKTSPGQEIVLLTDQEQELISQIQKHISDLKQSSTSTFTDTPSGKADPFN